MVHATTEQNALKRDIVVIGGSSGALQTLKFIRALPATFPAAIFIVLHTAPDGPALLPDIMRTYSALPVEHARDGETVFAGRIYVGLPDYHLMLRPGVVQVVRGPKENRHRPSIDVLFRSAADAYGPPVIGVVLSGMLDDGTAGLAAIRACGGLAIVQDPRDALFPDMPQNALSHAGADHCVPQSELASVLLNAVATSIPQPTVSAGRNERREELAHELSEVSMKRDKDAAKPGSPSDFSCPDCGGVLREVRDGKMLRFRCRVGHALSGQTLLAAQASKVEEALWTALRAIEEKAELARKLRDYAVSRNFTSAPGKFEREAQTLDAHAQIIRQLLEQTDGAETP